MLTLNVGAWAEQQHNTRTHACQVLEHTHPYTINTLTAGHGTILLMMSASTQNSEACSHCKTAVEKQ
jgi:hypothetical protein